MTNLPRAHLATWPTPLEPAPRLAAALGLHEDDLWIKRDDLTALAGGGNKIRKLEYTCGAALAEGATTLVTVGVAQSNHARLTAAAAARLGLEAVLILAGREPDGYAGNLALNGLLGARMVWAGDVDDHTLGALAEEEVRRLRAQGTAAALIPFGGSNGIAVHGYAGCGEELKAALPALRRVFTAVGSAGTMAGLVHSLGAERVCGVDCGAVDDAPSRVRTLIASCTGLPFDAPLDIRRDQIGVGYEHVTDAVKEALVLCARHTGIVLDPVYTGRALAGLVAAVHEGVVRRGEPTVFLHSGGLPGFFGNPDVLAFARQAAR
jgi:L-cysteate sulfo-lyase